MSIESIYEKHTGTGDFFKGRLFYAVITNSRTKSITFYCTKEFFKEGREVARGLPLFIRDHFKLDPTFFCSSDIVTESLQGIWDFEKRIFFNEDERLENERLNIMKEFMVAEAQLFISKDH